MAKPAQDKRNWQTDASREGLSKSAIARQKLPARFVDEISNISISPNGACRLHFLTWSTDDTGQPIRIDTELILTRATLGTLSEALPEALAQAKEPLDKTMADAPERSADET